jgi:hypothetical protein
MKIGPWQNGPFQGMQKKYSLTIRQENNTLLFWLSKKLHLCIKIQVQFNDGSKEDPSLLYRAREQGEARRKTPKSSPSWLCVCISWCKQVGREMGKLFICLWVRRTQQLLWCLNEMSPNEASLNILTGGHPGGQSFAYSNPTHEPRLVRPASGLYSPDLTYPNITSAPPKGRYASFRDASSRVQTYMG